MDLLGRPKLAIGGATLTLAAAGYGIYQLLRDVVMVLMILVILVLIGALVLLWLRQRKAKVQSQEIESTITRQADEDIERSGSGREAGLEGMKSEFVTAISALKKSKRGQAALSINPWYLVLGPAQSGKSTFVRQSGLSFLLTGSEGESPRPVHGVGGMRAFEWWLTQEAVLLEMPGRLLATSISFVTCWTPSIFSTTFCACFFSWGLEACPESVTTPPLSWKARLSKTP